MSGNFRRDPDWVPLRKNDLGYVQHRRQEQRDKLITTIAAICLMAMCILLLGSTVEYVFSNWSLKSWPTQSMRTLSR